MAIIPKGELTGKWEKLKSILSRMRGVVQASKKIQAISPGVGVLATDLDKCLAEFEHVRTKLLSEPRFVAGHISAFGWELEYIDGPSLVSCLDVLVVKRWNDFLPKDDHPVILDCGANIGISVLNYKRQFPNAKIVAFEPDPQFVRVLRNNLDRNGARDVDVIEAAVWREDGERRFFCEGADGSKLVDKDEKFTDTVFVQTVDLAKFISGQVDLIKMDIEGAEYEVIASLGGKLGSVKNMVIECHVSNRDIHPFASLLDTLASTGFSVSVNSYGAWRDLIRQAPKAPNEFDQYVLIAAWREADFDD